MLDRYTTKAFFKVTAPFWAMGLLLLAIAYIPWFIFVFMGVVIAAALTLLGILVKDEAAKMRSSVYNRRT